MLHFWRCSFDVFMDVAVHYWKILINITTSRKTLFLAKLNNYNEKAKFWRIFTSILHLQECSKSLFFFCKVQDLNHIKQLKTFSASLSLPRSKLSRFWLLVLLTISIAIQMQHHVFFWSSSIKKKLNKDTKKSVSNNLCIHR